MRRGDVSQLDMTLYTCVLVLCDERWMDPDEDAANGYDDIRTQGDLLRLDSMVLLYLSLHSASSLIFAGYAPVLIITLLSMPCFFGVHGGLKGS